MIESLNDLKSINQQERVCMIDIEQQLFQFLLTKPR